MAIDRQSYHRPAHHGEGSGLAGYTLGAVFADAVKAAGDAVAVIDADREYTWAQWRMQAQALARALQELGLGPGDAVGLWLPNCWEFLTLHVALAEIGAVQVPIGMANGAREAQAILSRTEARALVLPARHGERDFLDIAGRLRRETPSLRAILMPGEPGESEDADIFALDSLIAGFAGAEPRPVDVGPDDPLLAIASSGTTSSRPKICVHSHDGLLSNAAVVARQSVNEGRPRTLVSASPFTHLFGLLSIHVSLIGVGPQAILRGWDVEAFEDLTRRSGADVLYAVPAQLRDLLARSSGEVGLREVRTGGAAVPGGLVTDIGQRLGARVIVQWGMSEVGAGTVAMPDLNGSVDSTGIGRAVEQADVRIVDEEDHLIRAVGRIGHLLFRSPFMFRGYLADPELTAAAFTADGWLRTGDLGSHNADGTIAFRGRRSEQIEVGGVKFSALEVEEVLAGLPALDQVAVIGRPDARLGEYVCAVVSLRDGLQITLDEVIHELAQAGVAPYKWPAELIVLEALPVTPTGKVARGRLTARLQPAVGPEPDPQADPGSLPELLALIRDRAAAVMGADVIAPGDESRSFRDLGLDSSAAVRLSHALVEVSGHELTSVTLFDFSTPLALARHLAGAGPGDPQPSAPREPVPMPGGNPDDPIVVVGIGCRYPGEVRSGADLWRLVLNGVDAVGEVPPERGWDAVPWFDPEPATPGRSYTRSGGFLRDAAGFDPDFFGITPVEAAGMDPQQRILLETSWEALENAGIEPGSLSDSPTGVYIGMMASDYAPGVFESPARFDGYLLTGNASSVASGRIAYVLGLSGPALTIDTACSSSLVAVHTACRALERGDCQLALAGGVTVMSTPASFVEFSQQRALAPDGRCKAFSAAADGAGWAEGAGVLVLERASTASRRGHRALAIIRGSAVNQDGHSNGLTAPSGGAQQRVIQQALADARLEPADIDVVEAHGTGTTLGDAVEAEALIGAYGRTRPPDEPLLLGSVKSNLGHTQAAAGVTGLIKMIMAMRAGVLPPTLHAADPTPRIDWGRSGIQLIQRPGPWPERGQLRPVRRAAVSAFGISGTNAHVILESCPVPEHPPEVLNSVPFILSARTPGALQRSATRLAARLHDDPHLPLADVQHTLALGRARFDHRADVIALHRPGLLAALNALAEGRPSPDVLSSRARRGRKVVFVFPGQGSQWDQMAAELLATSPVFAASIANCEKAFTPFLDWSLEEALRTGAPAHRSGRPDVLQPMLFAVLVSLAALWRSNGVRPDAVVGHSQGEIAAAHVAGILSLDDAAMIVAARGRVLAGAAAGGRMAFVHLAPDDLARRLPPGGEVMIAAVNGPRSVVVAGAAAGVDALVAALTADGVRAGVLSVDFASHSPHMDPLRDELLAAMSGLSPRAETVPFHSTVDAVQVDGRELTAPYWFRNLRQAVAFAPVVAQLIRTGHDTFIEVSAHPVLLAPIEQTAADLDADVLALGTLRRDEGGLGRFRRSLAEADVNGVNVDWKTAFARSGGRLTDLPTYPFEARDSWTPRSGAAGNDGLAALWPRGRSAGDGLRSPRGSVLDEVRAQVTLVCGYPESEPVDADADLRELGMTSLAATRLREALETELGVRIGVGDVFDHPTAQALARHIAAKIVPDQRVSRSDELPTQLVDLFHVLTADDQVPVALDIARVAARLLGTFDGRAAAAQAGRPVRLRRGSAGPVVVCLPSVTPSGGPQEYVRFAAGLGPEREVVGLPHPGFAPGETLPADLEALLAVHEAAFRAVPSDSEVVLCGYSSGGLIAFALAASLEASGRPVAGVALLDTPWPEPGPALLRAALIPTADFRPDARRIAATGSYFHLLRGWRPSPISAPTLMVRARDPWPGAPARAEPGWPTPHLQVMVPGDHLSMMSGHVSTTADVVDTWLSTRETITS